MKTNRIMYKTLSGKWKQSKYSSKKLDNGIKLKRIIHLYGQYFFNKSTKMIYTRIYKHNQ